MMRTPVLALVLAASPAAEAQSVESELLSAAPRVTAFCKTAGYRSVGVLKFQVCVGPAGRPAWNAGVLNRGVADWLENALLATNAPRRGARVVTDATGTAFAADRAADPSTPEGRAKLFAHKYRSADGAALGPGEPDAFLWGRVHVGMAPDGEGFVPSPAVTSVEVLAFDRRAPAELRRVTVLRAATDAATVTDAGRGFRLTSKSYRNGNDAPRADAFLPDPEPEPESAKPEPARPDENTAADVALTVLYDGRPQPLTPRLGSTGAAVQASAFALAEPAENTRVTLRLENRSTTRRYGAVLFVGNRNTLDDETDSGDPLKHARWVVPPGFRSEVAGFYKGGTVAPFAVVPPDEARQTPPFAPDGVLGRITLHVLAEGAKPQPLLVERPGSKGLRTFAGAKGRPDVGEALAAHLRVVRPAGKGVIVRGTEVLPANLQDAPDRLKNPFVIESRVIQYRGE